jgi:hypothetical protein
LKVITLALFCAMTLFIALGITVQTFAQNTQPSKASQADAKTQAKILDQYGKLPLSFEVNHGQTDTKVKFLSRTSGYTLFLTSDEAVFALRGNKAKDNPSGGSRQLLPSPVSTTNAVLRMKLRNANPAAKMIGFDELPGTSNYFIGNDPAKWRTNVPNYAKVKYEGIYSGIDLVYYGNQRQLEYDFIVAPGADPNRIKFDVRGAKRIRRDAQGDLVLKMGEGEIRWHKPVVYQEKNGARQEIAANYDITDQNRVGFELAKYDARTPLYIDPLVYSTYLGGSSYDEGFGIAVDSAGNAYVIGATESTDFPTQNPLQPTNGGAENAFVTKINSSGSALVYSTYLGGSGGGSFGAGIAVDSSGNAYVTGNAGPNFPTMNPLQAFSASSGSTNAFVAKLNPTGSALVYSTYLGGSVGEEGRRITVDSGGNAYVTGGTQSTDFPTTPGAFQTVCGGSSSGEFNCFDTFVSKINPAGSALVFSTYLGGTGDESGSGIAVDGSGGVYVTGGAGPNFPVTPGAFQTTYGSGSDDAFVSKINPSGSALVYSTYLGGSADDNGTGIAVDSTGSAYVGGITYSANFPVTSGAFQTVCGGGCKNGGANAFVAKINPSGSGLVYSTYLGGSTVDGVEDLAIDNSGNAYVTGVANSTDFPTMNPVQAAKGGSNDLFVAEFNPEGSALIYSTYLGGSTSDEGTGIAVDSRGNAYITGQTNSSTNFPTVNPLQPTFGGGDRDAFVAKIASAGPRYSVCLLYDPTKAVHSGATIPIKLQLYDGSGNDLSSSTITVHAISVTQISTSTSGAVENAGNSNPDNDFRFDATLGSTGGYIFNLKTTGLSTGTYKVNFTVTGDSFVYAANFEVR